MIEWKGGVDIDMFSRVRCGMEKRKGQRKGRNSVSFPPSRTPPSSLHPPPFITSPSHPITQESATHILISNLCSHPLNVHLRPLSNPNIGHILDRESFIFAPFVAQFLGGLKAFQSTRKK